MQRKHLFSNSGFTGVMALGVAGTLMAGVVSNAWGAGFEKNVLWSGKWVGVGGAAVSAVQGAESLFFNPAGLAGRQGVELSGNFSPTWGQFKGPIAAPSTQLSSGYNFSPVFGLLGSYGITPKWSVGAGVFVSAGTKADFDGTTGGLSIGSGATQFPTGTTIDVHADLYVAEFSLGTAYEILPGLKIGGAWRIPYVKANLATAYAAATGINNAVIDGLSGTRYNGFRAGVQYQAEDRSWGLGLSYRSNVDFTVKGSGTVTQKRVNAVGGTTSSTNVTDVTASSALPTQFELGGNYSVVDHVRLYLDYVWTNYSHNQTLPIVGGGIPGFDLGWTNMSNVRIGASCTAVPDWTFRAGYVYTSQVVPNTLARATFSSPGSGNTITLGAGKQLMDNMMDVDAAVEHSFASGTTTAEQQTNYGEYATSDWALHLGVTYRM